MTSTIGKEGELLEGKKICKPNWLCVPCMVKIERGKIAEDPLPPGHFLNTLKHMFSNCCHSDFCFPHCTVNMHFFVY